MKSLSLSQPHLIAMVGAPGTGKSQFAGEFSSMFGAPHLSSSLIDALSNDEQVVRQTVDDLLKEMMKTHQTIIFEGATERRSWRADLARKARKQGYKTLFVWVQTDLATAKNRWMKQNANDEATFERKAKQFSPLNSSESYIVISGRHTYSTQAKTLLRHLTEKRPTVNIAGNRSAVSNRIAIG